MSIAPPFKATITSEEINDLPLRAFDGKIAVIDTESQLKRAFEEITQHRIVGFDTETRPVFVRGHSHPVSLMQVALPNKAFLLRLKFTGLSQEIINFLQSENILKVGVALRDDVKALQRLKRFKPNGIFELTELTRKSGIEAEGLKKLAALVLGFRNFKKCANQQLGCRPAQ